MESKSASKGSHIWRSVITGAMVAAGIMLLIALGLGGPGGRSAVWIYLSSVAGGAVSGLTIGLSRASLESAFALALTLGSVTGIAIALIAYRAQPIDAVPLSAIALSLTLACAVSSAFCVALFKRV